jgi:putative flippase GtrA
MALVTSRIGAALWRKARSNIGIRFTRFTLVAVAAVASTQIALALFIGPLHMTAGLSGGLSAAIGAAVSYLLSRWAWTRRGRPNLLKETLPFWVVSAAVWVILGLAAKLGVHLAASLHATGLERIAVTNGVVLAANCMTFVMRFVIFHYVLFADRSVRPVPAPGSPISSSREAGAAGDAEPFAMAGDPASAERGDCDPPDRR